MVELTTSRAAQLSEELGLIPGTDWKLIRLDGQREVMWTLPAARAVASRLLASLPPGELQDRVRALLAQADELARDWEER